MTDALEGKLNACTKRQTIPCHTFFNANLAWATQFDRKYRQANFFAEIDYVLCIILLNFILSYKNAAFWQVFPIEIGLCVAGSQFPINLTENQGLLSTQKACFFSQTQ